MRTRREELLDQVIDQLMTSGLNDLSLRQLAEAIGTSHRMLIYHFGTKETLVSDAVQEVRRRERVLFASRESEQDPKDPTGPLRASFEHNTSPQMAPYFRLLYEVWGIALVHPERYGRFLDGIITAWVDAFAGVLRRAGFSSRDARVRATLVLGALRGLQLDLYTTRDRTRVNAAFTALLSMLERELRDPERLDEPETPKSRPTAGADTRTEDL
ncbi:MAG: TetR/AcrR family transcriptional regulator [Solirubrobacterales bacterium]